MNREDGWWLGQFMPGTLPPLPGATEAVSRAVQQLPQAVSRAQIRQMTTVPVNVPIRPPVKPPSPPACPPGTTPGPGGCLPAFEPGLPGLRTPEETQREAQRRHEEWMRSMQPVPTGGTSRFPGLQRLLPLVGGLPGGGAIQAPTLGGRSLGYGHPPPPGVCCQAMRDGGTVCSDGFIGPAG